MGQKRGIGEITSLYVLYDFIKNTEFDLQQAYGQL